MTTRVTIDAHAGWPVKVSRYERDAAGMYVQRGSRIVPPGAVEEFAVWDGVDIHIHELKLGEDGSDITLTPTEGGTYIFPTDAEVLH